MLLVDAACATEGSARQSGALGAPTRPSLAPRSPPRAGPPDPRARRRAPRRRRAAPVGDRRRPDADGKTTGFAVPAILEWQGPVVATSVKTDLLRETIAARSAIRGAQTSGLRPHRQHRPSERRLDAARRVPDLAGRPARRRMARPRGAAGRRRRATPPSSGTERRPSCSRRSSSPPPAAAARWPRSSAGSTPRRTSASAGRSSRTTSRRRSDAFEAISLWDDKTRGSVYATAETVLIAYADPGVLASAMTAELRAELTPRRRLAHRLPLRSGARAAPPPAALRDARPGDRRARLRPHDRDRASRSTRRCCSSSTSARTSRRCATSRRSPRPGAGQGIQLVSVFQDMAQINAVYGRDRAPTIVSNHRAKVILSGHRRPADARLRRAAARRRGGAPTSRRRRAPRAATRRPSRSPTGTSRPRTSSARCGPARACSSTATSPRRESRSGPGSRTGGSVSSRRAWSPCGGRANVNVILEDLTTLPPKRLEKRLEELAREALPCVSATVFDGNPEDGLTVALHVDSRRRGDVLDLARVVEDDAAVQASCGWSLLAPSRRHPYWRLLLRMSFERPVKCVFTVGFDIREHPSDPLRAQPAAPPRGGPVRLRLRRPARPRPAARLDRGSGRTRMRARCALASGV